VGGYRHGKLFGMDGMEEEALQNVFCSVVAWADPESVSSCGMRWYENCNTCILLHLHCIHVSTCLYIIHGLGLELSGMVYSEAVKWVLI